MPKAARFRTKVLSGEALVSLQRTLKRRNAAFAKLTPAQQRVQIAQDVILQVKIGKLVPESTYFRWTDTWAAKDAERTAAARVEGDVEKVDLAAVTSQVRCQVCGIGSLFVAAVERADQLPSNGFGRDGHCIRNAQADYLATWFDEDDLDSIEEHFESVGGDSPIRREGDPATRMIMIMENIISNRGRFNPFRGAHKDDGKGEGW